VIVSVGAIAGRIVAIGRRAGVAGLAVAEVFRIGMKGHQRMGPVSATARGIAMALVAGGSHRAEGFCVAVALAAVTAAHIAGAVQPGDFAVVVADAIGAAVAGGADIIGVGAGAGASSAGASRETIFSGHPRP